MDYSTDISIHIDNLINLLIKQDVPIPDKIRNKSFTNWNREMLQDLVDATNHFNIQYQVKQSGNGFAQATLRPEIAAAEIYLYRTRHGEV
jgi:hypothetical protein